MLRNLSVLLVILGAMMLIGFLVIITPDNALVGLFRTTVSDNPADKVVTGPYPLERDMRALKANGVTTVISLLNPDIYYEDVLLAQEKELASKYGMTVLNFPMGSILGQRFGANYEANAAAAAKAAVEAPGKVYLHCYLGMHRIKSVQALLEQQPGVASGTYALRGGERKSSARQTDEAEAAYNAHDFDKAIALLTALEEPNRSNQLLLGWSHYRKGNLDKAKDAFMSVLHGDNRDADANNGLGYVALRQGNLSSAEKYFTVATQEHPNDAQSWAGLGLAHFRQGQLPTAQHELEKAVKLDPANADAADVLKKLTSPVQ
jgi:tetratricopeptide (TPR) repeat protein